MDILFELAKAGGAISWPSFNMILLKRILESGFLHAMSLPGTAQIFGLPVQAVVLSLTDKGSEFIREMGIKEF